MKKSMMVVMFLLVLALLPVTAQNRQITFHTGAVGGMYMEPGIIWANQWESAIPGLKVSCILGGSGINALTVFRSADPNVVGIVDTINAARSMAGVETYAPPRGPAGGIKNLRALWRFNVSSWGTFIARPQAVPAGVNTIGELLAKKTKLRIALTTRGSSGEFLAAIIFKYFGYTYQDLEKMGCQITFNNPDDIGALMIDGHADLTFNMTRIPASYILDMDSSIRDLKWLGIDNDVAKKLESEHGYLATNYPMGVYSTVKEPFMSIAQDHVVFVRTDMDENLVYQMVKAMLSDPNKVKSIAALTPFDASVVWKDTVFPLHPGAERAFKEMGYMK